MTCAIYIRKSRDDKDKASHRLTVQRQQLPEHARAQGWQVQIYDDGHASAARGKVEDLRERNRLESDIRNGLINIILSIELSRLSRDESMQDYVSWLHLCAEHGVKLATMTRTLDPAQPSDWMLLLMEGGFSSVEMKVLQSRMKEGRLQALREGRHLGGGIAPPYVYDKSSKQIRIDQDQLREIDHILTLAETHSARAIAQQVNRPEISIRRILSDNRLLFYQALREDPETGEMIQGDWPAIIDAERAARIRAGRRTRRTNAGRREYGALLSNLGILYCGYCGRTAKTWANSRTRKDGTRLDYYGCQVKNSQGACTNSRLIAQPELERRVLDCLFRNVADSAALADAWDAEQAANNPRQEIERLTQQLQKEQAKKQRLIAAITEGIIDFAEAKDQKRTIDTAIEQLQAQLKTARAADTTSPDWDAICIHPEEFSQLAPADQRDYLTLVIHKIRLYNAYALVDFRFPRLTGDRTARVKLPPISRGTRKGLAPRYKA